MSTDPFFIPPPPPLAIVRSPEQIAQDISASHDSVALINRIVAADQHSDEINNTVQRNVRHLRDCLTLPHIVETATDVDKAAYLDAAAAGDAWLSP
jgi:hypothetical protein